MTTNPVVHFELPADDRKRMMDFYATAFGWNLKQLGPEMGNYVLAETTETDEKRRPRNPGAINGGLYDRSKEQPYASLVIGVDDIKEHMKKVKAAGGTILSEPMPIPGTGLVVMFKDTEGNQMSMIQPETM